jgi:hypothetical protein
LSKYLKCRGEYYTELNGMPTSVSLFVWLPEERAKPPPALNGTIARLH